MAGIWPARRCASRERGSSWLGWRAVRADRRTAERPGGLTLLYNQQMEAHRGPKRTAMRCSSAHPQRHQHLLPCRVDIQPTMRQPVVPPREGDDVEGARLHRDEIRPPPVL